MISLKAHRSKLAALPLISLFMCTSALAQGGYFLAAEQSVPMLFGKSSSISSDFDCPDGWVMATIELNYGWDIGEQFGWWDDYINGVRFGCSPLEESGAMGFELRFQDELGYPSYFGNENGPSYNWSDCYSNHWLGLYGRTGDWIDQVGQNCSTITDLMNGVVTEQLPAAGGNGGAPNTKNCPAGYIPVGATTYITWNSYYVQGIELKCAKVVELTQTEVAIADAVAQVYAKICPDENAPCLYQVPLLQLMSVRSLEVEEHTNWFRNFIGLHKIDAKDSAECFARGNVERECFQEGVVDTDTLFLGADDLETRDDRTFHYSWGIYSYDYQTEVGEEKQYYELVLVEPQERPDNQDEIAVIHMNSPDCLEAADFTLQDPFTNVRTESGCRGKLHLGAGIIEHPSRQEITYNHQYTNMGELFYLNEVDGVTYKPYFSSTCSLKLDNDEVRAWLANPGDDKEIPVICALAGNIQQVNSLLHKRLIGDVNANNILAQSLWGFVGELGTLLSEASLLSEAALLSEQGQNLRNVALTLQVVGLSADYLINGLSILDAKNDIKACRDAHTNVTERHQCQEGPISDMLLSMMGLGLDVAGTVDFVTQLDVQTPGQTLEAGDLIEMTELEPLLGGAKNRYADYGAADSAANPLSDVTPLPEFTLNEMNHHEDNVSARDAHLHPGNLSCP